MPNNSLPEWDLTNLYAGINDISVKRDRTKIQNRSNGFIRKYKNKIKDKKLSSKTLLNAIEDYEKILIRLYKYLTYASLTKSKNNSDEKISRFHQSAQEFSNKINNQLLFFELEWVKHSKSSANKLMDSLIIKKYKQFLAHERQFKPYRLSEKEEVLMSKKAQSGSTALIKLYNEVNSNMRYSFRKGKKKKNLSYDQIMSYITVHPDRTVRKRACATLSSNLKENNSIYKFLLNTLLLDKSINDEIRNFKYPEQATYLSYQVSPETVDSMTQIIQSNYQIVENFYKAKKKYLGLNKLNEWDRYSNLKQKHDKEISWNEAKDIILTVFSSFSSEFTKIAELFFKNNWIDAKITKGKSNGAFCSYCIPTKHPFILINYTGKLRDVLVLAHELGHGIHAYLSRGQSILQYAPSTAIAEISSIFCETLVFEYLLNTETNKENLLNLRVNKIQDIFATIFRQNAFFLFEKDVHKLRREQGELSLKEINNNFQARMQEMFGVGLELTDDHKFWWMPVIHFFNYNFYVFAYSFGEMLSTALTAQYKKTGPGFIPDYIKALSVGGSKKPYQILELMGIDINKPVFWRNGIVLIEEYVNDFIASSEKR